MNKLAKVLAALGDVGVSGLRRLVPASEDLIRRNVIDAVDQMRRRSEVTGGFSFNPRTGKFREGGWEVGNMMATVPERVDEFGASLNRTPPEAEAVMRLLSDPYYMDRLRRGQYLGGWIDKQGMLALDPSQRFLNKNRSIVRGAKAGQEGGFGLSGELELDDMGNVIELPMGGLQRQGTFYPLTPDVVRQAEETQAARRALAIMVGAPVGAGMIGYAADRY